jgi:hypothetical protein
MEWNRETLKAWLLKVHAEPTFADDPTYMHAVGRALVFMYNRQTADEQATGFTNHNNGMGFSGADAEFLTSVAKSYLKYNRMTPKQTRAVAKGLARYTGQLLEHVQAKAQAAKVGA